MSIFANPQYNGIKLGHANASVANTTFALDSAYVAGVSGDSLAYVWIANENSSLTDFYFFVTAVAGTQANITLTLELRNDSAGNPGSTVHASTTCGVNGANTWARATFGTPYTLVMGTKYHIVVTNTSASPTVDYPTILRISNRLSVVASNEWTCRNSTNGGGTYSGGTTGQFVAVFKHGNSVVMGNPYTSTNTNYTSNQRERGFYIASRATALHVHRMVLPSGLTGAISGAKLYKSTTAPGSSPGAGEATGTAINANNLCSFFDSSCVLTASAGMRMVWTFSSNSVNPTYYTIQDYARYADVQAARMFGGLIYATIDNGSGGWTDDESSLPNSEMWIETLTEPTSGGGCSRGRITNA